MPAARNLESYQDSVDLVVSAVHRGHHARRGISGNPFRVYLANVTAMPLM
jgi:hypothetical protein